MIKYDYEWVLRTGGRFQNGAAENWWWRCFNRRRMQTAYDVLPENLGTAMDKITELAESALKESSHDR